MGLISIKAQTVALACKTILSVVAEGEHTLQSIYRKKIGDLSLHKWGIHDLSWLVAPCRTLPIDESKLWTNYYRAWNMGKRNVRPSPLANWEEKKEAPLWVPNTIHKAPFRGKSKSAGQRALIGVGITQLKDIIDRAGNVLPWEARYQQEISPTYRRAYTALCDSIDEQALRIVDDGSICTVYMAETPLRENTKLWQFSIPKKERKAIWRVDSNTPKPIRTLIHNLGIITAATMEAPEEDLTLTRKIIGLPRTPASGGQQLRLIAKLSDDSHYWLLYVERWQGTFQHKYRPYP